MTAGTARRCLNQGTVVRGVGGMGRFPGAGMTGGAGAAANRDPWQKRRNGAVAKVTITHMRDGHRRIGTRTWIVTGQTGGGSRNMTERHMIDTQVYG